MFDARIAVGRPGGPQLPPPPPKPKGKKTIPRAQPKNPGPGPMRGYYEDAPGGGILYCVWHIAADGDVVEDGCVWVVTPSGHAAGSDTQSSDSTR